MGKSDKLEAEMPDFAAGFGLKKVDEKADTKCRSVNGPCAAIGSFVPTMVDYNNPVKVQLWSRFIQVLLQF